MRKRSVSKFLAMLLLLAQLFSLTAGITVFAADENETERDDETVIDHTTTIPEGAELVSLPVPYARHNCSGIQALSMSGNNYAEGLKFDMGYTGLSNGGQGSASINLDGKFSAVVFDAGYVSGDERSAKLTVYGDKQVLLETVKLSCNDLPRTFTLDVTGVKQLKFYYDSGSYDHTYYGIGNLKGVQTGTPDTTVYTSDDCFDVPRYKLSGKVLTNEFEMAGKLFHSGYNLEMGYVAGSKKSVSFNFNGQYEEMSFDIGRYYGGKDDDNCTSTYLTIEADGTVLPEYDNLKLLWDDLVLPVTLDLTGVKQLTIKVSNSNYSSMNCRIANIQLKSKGTPLRLVLDATPVEGTDNYTATLTDKTPEIALNPRVSPSDAARDYVMTVTEGAQFISITEDGVLTGIHSGKATLLYTVPGTDISVECAVTSKVTAHVWDEGVVTKEPTLKEKGEKLYTCTVCEKTKTEKLDKLTECEEHTWNEGEVTKEPTYTEEGEKKLTCTVCGKTETAVMEKLTCTEHNWDDGEVTKEPTYSEAGEKLFTCSNCGETKTEVIGMLSCTEHNWNDGEVTKEPSAAEAGETTYTCTVCGTTKTEVIANNLCGENLYWKVEDGVLTIYTDQGDSNMYAYEKGKAPWYELRDDIHTIKMVRGITIGENAFYDLYNVTRVELPAGLIYFQNAFEGCKSLAEFRFPDGSSNGYSVVNDGTMVLRHAQYDDIDSKVVYACAPTVSGTVSVPAGYDTIHFGAFEGCGMTDVIFPTSLKLILPGAFKNCPALETYHYSGTAEEWAAVRIDSDDPNGGNDSLNAAKLHLQTFVPEKAVTCTESGNDAHYRCEECDLYYDAQDPGIIMAASPLKDAIGHEWDDGEITKEPTYSEAGEKTLTCSNCGETKTEVIDVLICTEHEWDNGKVVKEPTTETEGEKLFTCINCGETKTESIAKQETPFIDVSEEEYFFAPVLWAVQQGITGGIGAGQFGPHNSCTRGQVVTFLWRAAGSPEPKTVINPFIDVAETDYFYTPVLWAVEKGITGGTSINTFSPDATCTRAQVVTFLWRAAGSPEIETLINPFVDVFVPDYFYTPVLWAVQNGITGGTGPNTFSPNATCTRAQVVTFLYKASQVETDPAPTPDTTDLVTDVFTDTVTYNTQTYCYHIPEINLEGDLAKDLNKEIYDAYYEIVESHVYENMDSGIQPATTSLNYIWGRTGDLASIVMEQESVNNGFLTYEPYNFSTVTGKKVSDAEILEAYGMTVTSFYESVRFLLQGCMENEDYNESIPKAEIEKIIEQTLSDENVKEAKPFINANGDLSFITGTYWVAGAGYYYHLMDMKGNYITITCEVH